MKYITFILTLLTANLFSQGNGITLGFEEYMEIVKKHHPLAKQADIQMEKGSATVIQSRGNFDPKAFSDVSQKYFKDQQYYSLINSGLKIPTWYGIEINGGYENNNGSFLNPENSVTDDGLWYLGISVPLGEGLFIDKRRAELKKAKIYQQSSEAERNMLYNELLYKAGKAYWEWFKSYNAVVVYQEAVTIAEQRFEAIKRGAVLGDRPSIDTVEALIQLQNRTFDLQETRLNFKNTTALLGIYLWVDGLVPLEVSGTTFPVNSADLPPSIIDLDFKNQLDSLTANHPALQQSMFKVDRLKIDQRWKKEQIKPTLNLKYNAINQPVDGASDAFNNYSTNNYTWGLEFNLPIFLRKERGDLRIAKMKVKEAEFELTAKIASLKLKAQTTLNDWDTAVQQLLLYTQTVQNYNKLLEGEKKKFDAGESSLFLINSRESNYIKAQIRYIELLAKNYKASLTANYSFGLLMN